MKNIPLCLALFVLFSPRSSLARESSRSFREELRSIRNEVEGLVKKVERLDEEYRGDLSGEVRRRAKERFEEAIYSFLVEDYERAALLFLMAQEEGALRGKDEEKECQWYLAESLFFLKNYHLAVEYYAEILERGEVHPFYHSALSRLAECYGITGNQEKFEKYYSLFRKSGNALTERNIYSLAKSYYLLGQRDRAMEVFATLPKGSPLLPMAKYFAGVIAVEKGNLDEALNTFRGVLSFSVTTSEGKQTEELAHLAMGRILYEQGKFAEALDEYQQVSRESPYFAETLFEIIWTFIKKGDFLQAYRTTELFLLVAPDDARVPEVRLLQGHLLMERKDYQQAEEAFRSMAEDSRAALAGLKRLSVSENDIREYFQRLIEMIPGSGPSPSPLSPLVVERFEKNTSMGKIIHFGKTLFKEGKNIEWCHRTIEDLSSALASPDVEKAILSFRTTYFEIQRLLSHTESLEERLLRLEMDYMMARLPPAEKSQMADLKREFADYFDMGRSFSNLPDLIEEEEEVYLRQVAELKKKIFKLQKLAEDVLAQFVATSAYLQTQKGGQEVYPERRAFVLSEIEAEKKELGSIHKEMESLLHDLSDVWGFRKAFRLALEKGQKDRRNATERMESILRSQLLRLRMNVGDLEGRGFFSEVDEQRENLGRSRSMLKSLADTLDTLQKREKERIAETVRRENFNIKHLGETLVYLDREVEDVAVQAAVKGLASVRDAYGDLVMKAETGILDVYWDRKEKATSEIERVNAEQKEKMRSLEEKYRPLMGEKP